MGLLGTIGSVIGLASSAKSLFGKDPQKQAQQNAQAQMDFQERMSNTAYQRAMEDMRNAGLNPILAGRLGGASTPGGAMAPVLAPAMMSAQSSMMQANTAQQLAQSQTAKIDQEIENLKATEGLTKSQISKVSSEISKINFEAQKVGKEAGMAEILMDYYGNNKGALVAKDMGLTPIKYAEILAEALGLDVDFVSKILK